MSFEVDGFFSPEIDRFREAVRTTEPFKSWFDYALGLNRIGFDLLRQATSPATDPQLFAMHANFVRAHQSFQSALVLAERGLIPDTRTLVRSGVESAIALHALANDTGFIDKMIEAHHMHQRKAARIVLDTPAYLESYSPEEVAAMHAAIAEADVLEARLAAAAIAAANAAGAAPKKRKLQDIEWAAVADEEAVFNAVKRRWKPRHCNAPGDDLAIEHNRNTSARAKWQKTPWEWIMPAFAPHRRR